MKKTNKSINETKKIKEEPKRQNNKSWLIDVDSYCGSNTWENEPRKENRNTTNKRQQQKTRNQGKKLKTNKSMNETKKKRKNQKDRILIDVGSWTLAQTVADRY